METYFMAMYVDKDLGDFKIIASVSGTRHTTLEGAVAELNSAATPIAVIKGEPFIGRYRVDAEGLSECVADYNKEGILQEDYRSLEEYADDQFERR